MMRNQSFILFFLIFGPLAWGPFPSAQGQFAFDGEPINYQTTESNDRIAQLTRRLADGRTVLSKDDTMGWLPDLLKELDVASDSQTLVFSKTSLQLQKINPQNPRAIYFNDDVYVGYVPGGDVIELSAVDPQLGPVFYKISQNLDQASIVRDRHECMTCHATSKTKNVPGYLIRSVYPSESGHPFYGLGTKTTDHSTPFKDRFGGWYVTGKHGSMRHLGNSIADEDAIPPIDVEIGANRSKIPSPIDTDRYPADASDLVALMVLEHQTQMHNLITQASYEYRMATHYDATMNRILARPVDHISESTNRRIKSVGDRLVEYLFFSDEAKITSPIEGTSRFSRSFQERLPRDSQGRSLREFDLSHRMFKYPCSFLIYSDSFSQMPEPVLDHVLDRIACVVTGLDHSDPFAHLTEEDRNSICEILSDTLPGFADRLRTLEK